MSWKNLYYFSEFLYTKYPNVYISYVSNKQKSIKKYLTVFIIIHIAFDFCVDISFYTDPHINLSVRTLVFWVVSLAFNN